MTEIDRISGWLKAHEDEMTADIMELIRVDSVKGAPESGCPFGKGPAAALCKAEEIAKKYGFVTRNMDSYVLCIDMPGESGEKGLDVLAHLDVVPVNESEWKVTGPFEPVVKDGKLYGRGAADDKGPAITALYAMRALKELGIKLKTGIRLILGSDEESGSEDIEYYYSKEKAAPYTISPDADFPVVNVERGRYAPSITADYDREKENIIRIDCGSIKNVIPGEARAEFRNLTDAQRKMIRTAAERCRGCAEFSEGKDSVVLTVLGRSGHASLPEEALNALTILLECMDGQGDTALSGMLSALHDSFPFGDHYGEAAGIKMADEICGPLTVSPTVLQVMDGRLEFVFDARVPEAACNENVTEVLRTRLAKNGLRVGDEKMSRPHIVRPDSPFVKLLLSCYEQVKKVKGEPIAIGGGTYVHDVENGVAFGPVDPGVNTNMHGFDENIPLSQLFEAACIYALAMHGVCGENK